MKKTINTITNSITFKFEGLEPITLKMEDVNPSNQAYAALHGMAQRCGDAAAIAKCEANGFTVTEQMRRDAVAEVVAHYAGGSADWNMRAAGVKKQVSPVIAAIAERMGCSYEEAEAEVQRRMLAELIA